MRICLLAILTLILSVGCQQQDLGDRGPAIHVNDNIVSSESGMYAAPPGAQDESRAIQRSARLAIKVDDFEKAHRTILEHVTSVKGFIARNEQKRDKNETLSGTLIIRIPVDSYSPTIEFLKTTGTVFELFEQLEDLTDHRVDLISRLSNAKALEARILSILENQTGNIRDVIEAERELATVRQRIEELEQQHKAMDRKITYASITINLFVSSSPDVEARTWYGPLLHDLRDLGFVVAGSIGALITVIVAVTPWILLIWFVLRKITRRKKPAKPTEKSMNVIDTNQQ